MTESIRIIAQHYDNSTQEVLSEEVLRDNELAKPCNLKEVERWFQSIGQISSLVKDKFCLLNYAANIKLSNCNSPL